jgi:flavin-dependent dehydrogenase
MDLDVAVVGGGCAGTYSAWRLQQDGCVECFNAAAGLAAITPSCLSPVEEG